MKTALSGLVCVSLWLLAAFPAHSLVTFRAASSATGSGSTVTIPKPTGISANDVLIAAIAFNNSSASVTPPPGWISVNRMDNPGTTSNSLLIYRRTASGSEPTSYAWTVSGGAFLVGGVEPEPVADDAARKVTSECAGKAANSHSDTHTKPDRAVFIVRLRQVCH